jgi:AcrR family transcriptional regulator
MIETEDPPFRVRYNRRSLRLSKPTSMRSDAARNRDRLLVVAAKQFAAGNAVSLEAIAAEAGVGIGTLYRHFPTREALVEAVYRSELDELAERARRLLGEQSAFDALCNWMDRFAQYVATKHAMLDALRAAWSANPGRVSETRAHMRTIITGFIEAGVADGTIRPVDPADVTLSLSGILMAAANTGNRDQLRRLLALLTEGLRARR